ncbi:MAG: c-type cytochrome [Flavisolibacter sp.]
MKKLFIASGFLSLGLGLISCGAHGDDPGRAYMPDMYYSRAYETYNYNDVGGELDTLKARGINYNALPVPGTIARGDVLPYHFTSTNDSNRIKEADAFKNPLDSAAVNKVAMTEAQRLFLVNCAICHGPNLDGNGPLYNGGNGPYPAVPKNLMAPDAKAFTDGHIFFVITNGIRSMGSYASQLTPMQRWWVVKYIRSKQTAGGGAAGAAKDSTGAAGKAATGMAGADSVKKAK